MNEFNLTEDEMKDAINVEISKAFPKMLKDHKRITSYNYHMFEDLLQFCLSEFLSKKSLEYQYQLCCVDKKVINYMGRSMALNLKSSTSPYWNTYRRESYNYRGVYLAETDGAYIQGEFDVIRDQLTPSELTDPYDCMLKALDELDFYHKPLLTDYFIKGLTYQQMHEKYGISLRHLKIGVEKGLELIRQECKQTLL
jgi:hypothetical protein